MFRNASTQSCYSIIYLLLLVSLVGCTATSTPPTPTVRVATTPAPAIAPSIPAKGSPTPTSVPATPTDTGTATPRPTHTSTPSPAATETATVTATPSAPTTDAPSQTESIRAIYTLLIDGVPNDIFDADALVKVRQPTMVWDVEAQVPYATVQAGIPAITADQWQAFRTLNQGFADIPRDLPFTRTVAWLSFAQQADTFPADVSLQASWVEYKAQSYFAGTPGNKIWHIRGYILLSQIQIEPSGTAAFAVRRIECGYGCSRGEVVRFGWSDKGWRETEKALLWDENNPNASPEPTRLAVPSPTPSATPAPVGNSGTSDELAAEMALYEAFFNAEGSYTHGSQIVLRRDTAPVSLHFFTDPNQPNATPEGYLEYVHQQAPTVEVATWNDFAAQNHAVYILPEGLRSERPITLVSEADIEVFFSQGEDLMAQWDAFEAAYPNAGGYNKLSRVGFNAERTQALVYVANSCGPLCGAGFIVLLEAQNGEWAITQQILVWIS